MKKRAKHKEYSSGFPTAAQVDAELNRVKYKSRYKAVFRSTVFTLITVAAVAVLISMLWMPVLKIYGDSMSPTLAEGADHGGGENKRF